MGEGASHDRAGRDTTYEVTDGVARLTIDRPERANALSRGAMRDLLDRLQAAGGDPAVRVLQLTGAGRIFCAGRDLKELVDGDGDEGFGESPMTGVYRNVCEALLELPKPTVAVVNGPAVAAGCELALACDLRVMASEAYLELPEARRGLGANFASAILPHLVPRGMAFEMLYLGARISADRALGWGLVNRVASEGELEAVAQELCVEITRSAPLSLRRIKMMMTRSMGVPVPLALRLDVGPDPYQSSDRLEGARAFLDRRDAEWSGR